MTYIQGDLAGSSSNISHETANQLYIWSEIRSNISYLPYLRLEYSEMRTTGKSIVHLDGSTTVTDIVNFIDDIPLFNLQNQSWDSILSQRNYEVFLFYELYNNDAWLELDGGAGIKKFSFDYLVKDILFEGQSFYASEGDYIPMIYLSTRIKTFESIQSFDSAFQADGKIYLFGDSDIYDYQLKMDFMAPYNNTTDLGVEVGYKYSYFNIKGGDVDVGSGSMTYSGIFFGFIGHFR